MNAPFEKLAFSCAPACDYSALRPHDLLIQVTSHDVEADEEESDGPGEQAGQYLQTFRTISNVVILGQLLLDEAEAADGVVWAEDLRRWAGDEPIAGLVQSVPHRSAEPVPPSLLHKLWEWAAEQGITGLDATVRAEPYGCWAAPFHHDGENFPEAVFCIVWVSDEVGLDLVFPHIDTRIPLSPGVVVVFDPQQPHGVIAREMTAYCESDYAKLDVQTYVAIDFPCEQGPLLEKMNIETHKAAPGQTFEGRIAVRIIRFCSEIPRPSGRGGKEPTAKRS